MNTERNFLAAAALMAAAAVLAAVDAVLVRLLTHDLHPFVIVFFRSLFGLLFVMPWLMQRRRALKSHYRLAHLMRALLKMLSFAAFFTAIAGAALADVTAIAFTTPVFVTAGAWIFLGEKPVAARVAAVVCSFFGVLIILQPSGHGVSVALLLALAGALLAAIIQVMLKAMSFRDSTETLVAWNLILTVPLAAIPLFWFWQRPDLQQIGLLALQGGAGLLSMICTTRAMALAQASYLAPIDFLRLPTVALFALVIFNEMPASTTFLGAAIIFGSTLIMMARSRKGLHR